MDIVGCTSCITNESDYFISCGANRVLDKPIKPGSLLKSISNLFIPGIV